MIRKNKRAGSVAIFWPMRRAHPNNEAQLERVKGIEPSLSAWEAEVLPLNYTRKQEHYPRLALAMASPVAC